jgi:hypothetical protein
MVIYPNEIDEFVEAVKTGRHHTLFIEAERVGTEIATLCCGWERSVDFKVIIHEEARQEEPLADSWILPAQNASIGVHSLVTENGRGANDPVSWLLLPSSDSSSRLDAETHDDGSILDSLGQIGELSPEPDQASRRPGDTFLPSGSHAYP